MAVKYMAFGPSKEIILEQARKKNFPEDMAKSLCAPFVIDSNGTIWAPVTVIQNISGLKDIICQMPDNEKILLLETGAYLKLKSIDKMFQSCPYPDVRKSLLSITKTVQKHAPKFKNESEYLH